MTKVNSWHASLLRLSMVFVLGLALVFAAVPASSPANAAPATNGTSLAVNLGAGDALAKLSAEIAALPDSAFANADAREALLGKIDAVLDQITSGAYQGAIGKLESDIRVKITRWVVASEQAALLDSADVAIAAVENAAQTTVSTVYGKVAGADAGNNSWEWKGLPYAKPPVGALRWKAPRNPDTWDGVRQSTDTFSVCTQPAMSRMWIPLNQVVGGEDCLYLNVFRPKTDAKNLPVYVFIHGGSNYFGGAHNYDGSNLASTSNMIVVAIQYRLGPLGWFTHPALNQGGDAKDKSGNYGTLDTMQALTWVRDNIAFFGGNPDNVTVGGESAGAANTINLLASPLASGLFHRAVIESFGVSGVPVSTGVALANGTIDQLLVLDGTAPDAASAAAYRAGMTDAQIEAYLASKTGQEIERARMNARGSIDSSPFYLDGVVMPANPLSLIDAGTYNQVPVIVGSNQWEMKPFLPLYYGTKVTSTGKTWFDVYQVLDGKLTLDQVFSPTDMAEWNAYAAAGTIPWNNRTCGLARSLKAHQDDVYCYYFKWGGIGSGPAPYDFIIGAGHATELPFFFGWDRDVFGYSFVPENEAGRVALQQAMMTYLGQFAATGDPNAPDSSLPVWDQWSDEPAAPNTIAFDGTLTDAVIEMINWVLP